MISVLIYLRFFVRENPILDNSFAKINPVDFFPQNTNNDLRISNETLLLNTYPLKWGYMYFICMFNAYIRRKYI
jgi:hypothetical protein